MSRRLSGLKAKKTGDLFERLMEARCRVMGIGLVRLPPIGARIIKGRGKILHQLEKMPFDYVLLSKNGVVAFVDAKTRQKSFTYSDIQKSPHQLQALLMCDKYKHIAGYVVWYQETNEIEFIHVIDAFHVEQRSSLGPGDCLPLGNLSNFQLERIFDMVLP